MKFAAAALVATASANTFDFMGEDDLLAQLQVTLSSAQRSEARGDADAAGPAGLEPGLGTGRRAAAGRGDGHGAGAGGAVKPGP